jgi:hypothetical protein
VLVSLAYAQIQCGRIDFDRYFQQFKHALPRWGRRPLACFGLTDISAVREQQAAGLMGSFEASARHALSIRSRKGRRERRTILID